MPAKYVPSFRHRLTLVDTALLSKRVQRRSTNRRPIAIPISRTAKFAGILPVGAADHLAFSSRKSSKSSPLQTSPYPWCLARTAWETCAPLHLGHGDLLHARRNIHTAWWDPSLNKGAIWTYW